MLGHCLGGQLIAKALGGSVTRSTVDEIGWLPVDVIGNDSPEDWSSELPPTLHVFQWHNETFSIPRDARHLFHRHTCPNQGFQIGNSLALQFHLEILADIVEDWSSRIVHAAHPVSETVQSRETMVKNLSGKVNASRSAADRIYSHWCRTLR
jgi:GMP synthase-like glutamine amidotransferase